MGVASCGYQLRAFGFGDVGVPGRGDPHHCSVRELAIGPAEYERYCKALAEASRIVQLVPPAHASSARPAFPRR